MSFKNYEDTTTGIFFDKEVLGMKIWVPTTVCISNMKGILLIRSTVHVILHAFNAKFD